MIDLHIHGAFGVDVLNAQAGSLDALAAGLAARGVTGFLPTLVPVPLAQLVQIVERLGAWIRGRREGDNRGALPLGLHLEGPFVSPRRAGALHPDCLLDAADARATGRFLEIVRTVPGHVLVTMAPEIPGGLALVRQLARSGAVVSIGHTEADAATLDSAFAAGARHMTHFGNAMRPLHQREVGPLGWGLLNDGVTVDVIGDLQHLAPEMLRLVLKAKGAARVALISDAVPAAGLPDGTYEVWGEPLQLSQGCVRNGAGALAGSASLLDEEVANLERIGLAADVARACARDVPARVLGLA